MDADPVGYRHSRGLVSLKNIDLAPPSRLLEVIAATCPEYDHPGQITSYDEPMTEYSLDLMPLRKLSCTESAKQLRRRTKSYRNYGEQSGKQIHPNEAQSPQLKVRAPICKLLGRLKRISHGRLSKPPAGSRLGSPRSPITPKMALPWRAFFVITSEC